MNQIERDAWTRDYRATCDKAERLAAMGMLEDAVALWYAFDERWEATC